MLTVTDASTHTAPRVSTLSASPRRQRSDRGVFFRPNTTGTTHRNGVRGEWWISYFCALGHRHREKISSHDVAKRSHARRREQVRQESYCPRIAEAANARPRLFEDVAKEYEAWSKAHKKSWQTDIHWLKRLKKVFGGKTLCE